MPVARSSTSMLTSKSMLASRSRAALFAGQLARASWVGRAETLQRPGPGFCRFDVTGARRGIGHQGVEQFLRSLRHLLHRPVESRLVYLGGPRKSAQLA